MGKTTNNMVALNDDPKGIYAKVMSWPDSMIVPGFETATNVSLAEVFQIKKDLQASKNPKKLKMLLAYNIVKLYHGTPAAIAAEEHFKQVFEEKLNPDEMPVFKTKARNIVDVLLATKLATSKSDARRLIAQGAVRVDTRIIKDEHYDIGAADRDGIVIQKGKRHFAKVVR